LSTAAGHWETRFRAKLEVVRLAGGQPVVREFIDCNGNYAIEENAIGDLVLIREESFQLFDVFLENRTGTAVRAELSDVPFGVHPVDSGREVTVEPDATERLFVQCSARRPGGPISLSIQHSGGEPMFTVLDVVCGNTINLAVEDDPNGGLVIIETPLEEP